MLHIQYFSFFPLKNVSLQGGFCMKPLEMYIFSIPRSDNFFSVAG